MNLLHSEAYKHIHFGLCCSVDAKGTVMQICDLFFTGFAIVQAGCRQYMNRYLGTALGIIGQSLVMYVVVSLMGLIDYYPQKQQRALTPPSPSRCWQPRKTTLAFEL